MRAMADKERSARLRSVPMFADLGDEAVDRVLDHAAEFEAAKGHVLVERGLPGAGLFVIEQGTVVVELRDREVELHEGDFFGEISLLDDSASHMARVRAATPVRCLALARDDLLELLQEEPRIAIAMLKTLARRMNDSRSPSL
jgi:CRP-like cAMP-binding protein